MVAPKLPKELFDEKIVKNLASPEIISRADVMNQIDADDLFSAVSEIDKSDEIDDLNINEEDETFYV